MNLGLKFLIILQFAHFPLPGQNKVRIPAWSFQDDHTTIVGLGVGLARAEQNIQVNTKGLRFERLGRGVFLISNNPPDEKPVTGPTDIIYGINISPFGTLSQNVAIDGISLNIFPTSVGRVNGILVSWPTFSMAETMNGLQISFLASVASDINGIQAGIGNSCQKKCIGIQVALGANESTEFRGCQISPFYNKATTASSGLQLSMINLGEEFQGVQIGLFNKANNPEGLPVGLINISGKRILPFMNW